MLKKTGRSYGYFSVLELCFLFLIFYFFCDVPVIPSKIIKRSPFLHTLQKNKTQPTVRRDFTRQCVFHCQKACREVFREKVGSDRVLKALDSWRKGFCRGRVVRADPQREERASVGRTD